MSLSDPPTVDTLCRTARDIARTIAGLADELAALRHPHAPATPSRELILKQIAKLQDQTVLLSSVLADIARHAPEDP